MIPSDETIEYLQANIPTIQRCLGLVFKQTELLTSAFVHRSYINEHKDLKYSHNERLEFLGDAVLNLIVTEFLFITLPDTTEGELSSLRSMAVSSSSCLKYVEKLGLQHFVLMGRGEKIHGKKGLTSILADHFEAILGAIYLEFGLEKTRHFFLERFSHDLKDLIKNPQCNWKALLQQYTQKHMKAVPEYVILNQIGPDHEKQFTIGVYVENTLLGTGVGASKKEAEQEAAKNALETLDFSS